MYRASLGPARLLPALMALAITVLGLAAVADPASAEPGNGNGTPPAHAGQPGPPVATAPPATDPAPAAAAPVAPAAHPARPDQAARSADDEPAEVERPSPRQASGHSSGGNAGTSGDVAQPQPVSGADDNAGGANGQCPDGVYCSTRDGAASGNGNDVGNATGKPCAGCVGKADNKNPPGQAPDAGADGDNGYECDVNNGIGAGKDGTSPGNPAHTGCTTSPVTECPPAEQSSDGTCTPPAPGCPPGQVQPDGTCAPPGPGCPPGQVQPDGTCTAGPPSAGCVPSAANDFCAEILGAETTAPPTGTPAHRPPVVAGVEQLASPAAAATGVLPDTGSSSLTGWLATAGTALLLLGATTLASRRRSSGA